MEAIVNFRIIVNRPIYLHIYHVLLVLQSLAEKKMMMDCWRKQQQSRMCNIYKLIRQSGLMVALKKSKARKMGKQSHQK
jgi:hypothetical protein